MTSRDFCFWLQGFFELGAQASESRAQPTLSAAQLDCVKRHLALVFKHEIDPSMGDAAKQAALDALHHEVKPVPMHVEPPHRPPPPFNGLYRC